MTALTSQELIDMRAVADDFFPDICTIQTPTDTTDASGGVSTSYANTYTNVACRLDPDTGGGEASNNFALESGSEWWLNIPYDQAIDATYRVVHSGSTYEVSHVMDTHSYATIRRAALIRID
jgi:hypothetical protein